MLTHVFMSHHFAEVMSAATSFEQVTPDNTSSVLDLATMDAFQRLPSET